MTWTELNSPETEATGDYMMVTRCFTMPAVGGFLLRVDKTLEIQSDGQTLYGGPATAVAYKSGVTPASISWGSPSTETTETGDLQIIKTRTYTGTLLDSMAAPLPGTIYRIERYIEADNVPPVAAQIELVFV